MVPHGNSANQLCGEKQFYWRINLVCLNIQSVYVYWKWKHDDDDDDDDDDDNEDDGNGDNDAPSTKF